MSDTVSPARPPTARSHRRHSPHGDAFVLTRIRHAVVMPLLLLAVLLLAGLAAWRATDWPAIAVLTGAGCALAAVAYAATRAVRAAAAASQEAAENAVRAHLAPVVEAAEATEKAVQWSADQLCGGMRPPVPARQAPRSTGPAGEAESALNELQVQAVMALLRVHDKSASVVLLEVLRRLALREHALVAKALGALSELEKLTDDPELLARIFEIDHLVTRMRRQVESTAVLGGQSLRSGRQPFSVALILRGAISEVVHYARVSPVLGSVGTGLGLPGHVAPDLMHLLAELIENSCECSAPDTKVTVRAQQVARGLAIEVEDRAVPMAPGVRETMNWLLAAPDEVDVSDQVRAGRIGLLVAAKIAEHHGFLVQLQENATGGTTALVMVPAKLLVQMPPTRRAGAQQPQPPGQAAQQQRPTTAQTTADAPRTDQQARPHAHPRTVEQPRPDGATPLPRRPRTHGALRAPAPDQPATAARPGLAAAFLTGSRKAGRETPRTPPEQA